MDTTRALRAIAWGEWRRCQRICAAVLGIMLLYVALLRLWDGFLREDLAHRVPMMSSGFDMLARSQGTTQEFFLIPLLLVAAMLCGVVGAFEGTRGLEVALPARYLTVPVHAARVVMTLFGVRLLLLLPLFLILALAVHVLNTAKEYPFSVWLAGAVVGAAAPLATAMWRHRIGALSLWLGLFVPAGLWVAGMFDYFLVGETPTALPGALLAIAGLLSGSWLLSRGGALESFQPPQILSRNGARQAATPEFSNAAAALRWSVRPRYLGWVLPTTALSAIPPMLYASAHEIPMIHALQWLPWTPGYVMPMALAQAVLVRWTHFAIEFLPWIFGLAAALEGLHFLRTNVLRRPIHFRLPITSDAIARHAGLAVLGEMLRVTLLCAILFGGLQTMVSGPNIGAQYVWPEVSGRPTVAYLDTAYSDAWHQRVTNKYDVQLTEYFNREHATQFGNESLPGIFSVLLETRIGIFLTLVSVAWTAFWPILWIAVPLCWEAGLEGLFLVLFLLWMAWRQTRARHWLATGIFLASALFFGIAYVYVLKGYQGYLEHAWIDSPQRALLGSVALVLMPMATLWGITRTLRHG